MGRGLWRPRAGPGWLWPCRPSSEPSLCAGRSGELAECRVPGSRAGPAAPTQPPSRTSVGSGAFEAADTQLAPSFQPTSRLSGPDGRGASCPPPPSASLPRGPHGRESGSCRRSGRQPRRPPDSAWLRPLCAWRSFGNARRVAFCRRRHLLHLLGEGTTLPCAGTGRVGRAVAEHSRGAPQGAPSRPPCESACFLCPELQGASAPQESLPRGQK